MAPKIVAPPPVCMPYKSLALECGWAWPNQVSSFKRVSRVQIYKLERFKAIADTFLLALKQLLGCREDHVERNGRWPLVAKGNPWLTTIKKQRSQPYNLKKLNSDNNLFGREPRTSDKPLFLIDTLILAL